MAVDPNTSAIITSANDVRPSFAYAPENPDPVAAPAISGGAPNVPTQAPNVGTPSATAPAVPTSSNKLLHGFIGSVLSGTLKALAGPPTAQYVTDKDGRTIKDPNQVDTNAARGRRLAAHVFEGLGAGANVPPQKSGLASALAGMAAGAGAVTAEQRAADELARKQERENAEAVQQKILRRAQTARENVLTYTNFKHMIDEDLDRDPERKGNLDLVQAAKESDIPVSYITESELRQQHQDDMEKVKQDPSYEGIISTHRILPVDLVPVKGPDGLPLTNENGIPRMEGKFALIDGYHDGNIKLPASFVTDVQKYVSGTEGLKPGEEMSSEHFKTLRAEMLEGKKQEMAGWAKPELGWQGDTPIQINSNNPQKTRSFPTGIVPNVENKPEDTAAQKKLREAQTREADAKAKEALANAAAATQGLGSGTISKDAIDNVIKSYGNLPKSAQAVLKSLNPNQQSDVLQLWAGRKDPKDFTTNPRKGSGEISRAQATRLVQVFDPTWRENKFETVKRLDDDFTSGKTGTAIQGFGQLMQHMAEAVQDSNNFQRTNSPILDIPLNKLRSQVGGNAEIKALDADIIAARNEWMNVIKNGHAADKAETDAAAVLLSDSSSPRQILTAINAMGKQSVARLGEINNRYKTVTGANYPNIISPEAKAAAESLGLGPNIARFSSGGTLFSGASPIANRGANSNPQSGQSQGGQNMPPVPQGMTRIQDSQGGFHDIPKDKLQAAQQRDPGLKVIQ